MFVLDKGITGPSHEELGNRSQLWYIHWGVLTTIAYPSSISLHRIKVYSMIVK